MELFVEPFSCNPKPAFHVTIEMLGKVTANNDHIFLIILN